MSVVCRPRAAPVPATVPAEIDRKSLAPLSVPAVPAEKVTIAETPVRETGCGSEGGRPPNELAPDTAGTGVTPHDTPRHQLLLDLGLSESNACYILQLAGAPLDVYVATTLDVWVAPHLPGLNRSGYAVDVQSGRQWYRRLGAQWYAWLRARVTAARDAHAVGRLPDLDWQAARARFNAIHAFAAATWGQAAVEEAVRAGVPMGYALPGTVPTRR